MISNFFKLIFTLQCKIIADLTWLNTSNAIICTLLIAVGPFRLKNCVDAKLKSQVLEMTNWAKCNAAFRTQTKSWRVLHFLMRKAFLYLKDLQYFNFLQAYCTFLIRILHNRASQCFRVEELGAAEGYNSWVFKLKYPQQPKYRKGCSLYQQIYKLCYRY